MDDPLGKHRKALDDLAKVSEQVRRTLEPSKAMRDALDAITGGPSMRLIKDMMAKDALHNALSPPNSASEILRTMKLTEDMNRRMLGLNDLPLKSVLAQFAASTSWLDKTLAITNPPWMKAVEAIAGIGRSQRMFEDMTKGALATSRMFDQHSASLRAINDIIKPALAAQQPITELLGRLGLNSAAQLRDLYEPASFRAARETLARIQSEQAAFTAALPSVTSPFAGVDWDRMRRIMDQTAAYAEATPESGEMPDAWDLDDIPAEEQAEFAEVMRPVVEAVEAAVSSPDRREEKQAEAITAILAYCERIVAKQEEQDQRLDGVDAKLAKQRRSKVVGWILALLLFLANTGWDLSKEWAASHTTPAINQVLGLLDEPVSSAKQPSAIRRDAAEAVAATPLTKQDARYLRVVTRKSLAVYANLATAEPCIHRLRSGQIVAIVQRDKKWRLVEWFDGESGEFKSGWVRAKYIDKIRP